MKTIDFKTAQEIYKNQELDNCPVPAINKKGKGAIKNFLKNYAREENQDIDQWCDKSELAAFDLLGEYDALIEIRGFHTVDKHPHVLKLSPDFFDWAI